MVVTSTVYRNPLKTRLTEYEWQLQEARSRYTEQNPKVIKLQTRVDVLTQMIDESNDEGAPENLYSANTKLVALQDRQRELRSDIRIRDAQIAALSQSVQQTRGKLAALTEAEKDFQLLQQRMSSVDNLEATLVGRVEEAKVVMLRNEAAFELFEAALPPTEPAPSPKRLIAAAGVVLGGASGLLVVLLLELMDPLVRNRRDASGVPGVSLAWELQKVPAGHYALVDAAAPGDPVAIFFRRLINDLDARLDPEEWMCLGVTSADPEVGRTLAATNLAQALAMKEYPVILVDADLRPAADTRPGDLFEIPPASPGLLQALCGEAPIAALLRPTETPGLSLVTAGFRRPDHAGEAQGLQPGAAGRETDGPPRGDDLAQLGSRRFRSVLDTLRQSGRHLVYDLPPIGTHETVLEAAAGLGSVILVARSGQTTRVQLRETVQLLGERGAKVCGILVTDVRPDALDGAPLFPYLDKRGQRWRWLRGSTPAAARRRDATAEGPDPHS
jgi:tyrosine-protein kinase Etk/Wzc